jgi:hypothetical protein
MLDVPSHTKGVVKVNETSPVAEGVNVVGPYTVDVPVTNPDDMVVAAVLPILMVKSLQAFVTKLFM